MEISEKTREKWRQRFEDERPMLEKRRRARFTLSDDPKGELTEDRMQTDLHFMRSGVRKVFKEINEKMFEGEGKLESGFYPRSAAKYLLLRSGRLNVNFVLYPQNKKSIQRERTFGDEQGEGRKLNIVERHVTESTWVSKLTASYFTTDTGHRKDRFGQKIGSGEVIRDYTMELVMDPEEAGKLEPDSFKIKISKGNGRVALDGLGRLVRELTKESVAASEHLDMGEAPPLFPAKPLAPSKSLVEESA